MLATAALYWPIEPSKMPRIRLKQGCGHFYLLVLTDKSIGLDERLLKTGNIHFSHRTVILQRQRGRPGRFSQGTDNGHDVDRGLRFMGSRDTPAGHQQIFRVFRDQAAIGNQ